MEYLLKEGNEEPRLFIASNRNSVAEMIATSKDLTMPVIFWPKNKPNRRVLVDNFSNKKDRYKILETWNG